MTVAPFFRPYKYKLPRPRRFEPPASPKPPGEDEGLTGFVQGREASDLEERFARALNTYGLDYRFEALVDTAFTLPYQEKQVDFMVYTGQTQPWEVDGTFTHKSGEQKEYDRQRDAQIDEALKEQNAAPVRRVTEEYLGNQAMANMFVAEFIA